MSYECTVHLTIHQWDKEVEGKQVRVKLPKKMKVVVSIEDGSSVDEIHDAAMDKASDETGWCIKGCSEGGGNGGGIA